MKKLFNTIKLAVLTIKISPFFLIYGITDIILNMIQTLIPIGVVQIIVTYYNEGKNFKKIIIVCLGTMLMTYLIQVIYYFFSKLYNKNYRNFSAKYQKKLFIKLKEIDYEEYNSSSFLNNFTRAIDEGSNICLNSFWNLSSVLNCLANLIVIFSIFATIDPIIILYAVIIGIIFFILSKYSAKLNWILSEKQKKNYRQRGYVKRMFYLKDSVFDIRTTKIDNLFLEINDQIGDRVIKNTDKELSKQTVVSFISQIFIRSIYPVTLGFIAYTTLKDLAFATFVAMTVAANSLSNFIWDLSSSLADLETVAAKSEAVFIILNKKGTLEVSGTVDASTLQKISINNMSFSYGEKEVLKDVSLDINKGDKIAIVGENGAGKTTLVKLLLRLYDVTGGSIIYNGNNYKDIKPKTIRNHIGSVFQDFQIYSFTIAENVLMRKIKTKEDEQKVIEALKFSGLYDVVCTFEKGINTILTKEFDKNGIELSGGQRQKLVIARVYAGNYDLIILDEPNSALDPLAEAEIYEKMMALGKDKTLIFISHRLSTTIKADVIYLFENGKIIEKGTHYQLMQIDEGKYKYMFNVQAKNYQNGGLEYENN